MDIVFGNCDSRVNVGDLKSGTLVRGVPNYPEVLYMVLNRRRVHKKGCGTAYGVTLSVEEDLTALVNLNYGGIRGIPSCTPVDVYEGKLHASPLPYNRSTTEYMTKEALKRNF
jgi:hypothetical protein